MNEINCNNCAICDFKESLCHKCDEMKRLGSAEDIEKVLISTEWYNKMAERLTELEYKEAERQWIPISERLPELDEVVLATTAWNDITIAWRINVCNWWFIHEGDTNAETDDIIAWMPLPEPYKGEDE